MATVLVTGGAGYIGSHTVKALQADFDTVVLDDLSRGHREAVAGCHFVEGDVADGAVLQSIFETHSIDAVLHFAAESLVGESVAAPLRYYRRNVGSALALLDAMATHGVEKLVFSSSAAVYGEPARLPIPEDHPLAPCNPYGHTKRMIEQILEDCARGHGLRFATLRYFNAAGADPDGGIGEDHEPETHLVPLILQAAMGLRDSIRIFGTDYPTPDGTCVRDYVHVTDLADAHVLALKTLSTSRDPLRLNLGNGAGYSVREVVEAARRVTGCEIPVTEAARRPGDPARLVASADRARDVLGWTPAYGDLAQIVETAWNWHRKHPQGFGSRGPSR